MTIPPFMMTSRARVMDYNGVASKMKASSDQMAAIGTLKRRRDSSVSATKQELAVTLASARFGHHTLGDDQLLMMERLTAALSRGGKALHETPPQPAFKLSQSALTSRLASSDFQTPKNAGLTRVKTVPTLSNLLGNNNDVSTPVKKKRKTMGFSASSPELSNKGSSCIVGPASASESTRSDPSRNDVNPEVFLKHVIRRNGCKADTVPSLSLKNFFLDMDDANVAAYGADVITAVRQENIEELREMLHSGKNLQCCNKFGESIVHMACRRGSERVLKFLLEEAMVSIRVRDDYGRTPLHDACWTRVPEFGLMSILIRACPDLLLVSDKRGHTPLSYVRRDHWNDWCVFLKEHSELLRPRELF